MMPWSLLRQLYLILVCVFSEIMPRNNKQRTHLAALARKGAGDISRECPSLDSSPLAAEEEIDESIVVPITSTKKSKLTHLGSVSTPVLGTQFFQQTPIVPPRSRHHGMSDSAITMEPTARFSALCKKRLAFPDPSEPTNLLSSPAASNSEQAESSVRTASQNLNGKRFGHHLSPSTTDLLPQATPYSSSSSSSSSRGPFAFATLPIITAAEEEGIQQKRTKKIEEKASWCNVGMRFDVGAIPAEMAIQAYADFALLSDVRTILHILPPT